jgi:hypothetical protein
MIICDGDEVCEVALEIAHACIHHWLLSHHFEAMITYSKHSPIE